MMRAMGPSCVWRPCQLHIIYAQHRPLGTVTRQQTSKTFVGLRFFKINIYILYNVDILRSFRFFHVFFFPPFSGSQLET